MANLDCIFIVENNLTRNAYAVDNESKKANIRNRYNQIPHLTQDPIWESDKTQENTTH